MARGVVHAKSSKRVALVASVATTAGLSILFANTESQVMLHASTGFISQPVPALGGSDTTLLDVASSLPEASSPPPVVSSEPTLVAVPTTQISQIPVTVVGSQPSFVPAVPATVAQSGVLHDGVWSGSVEQNRFGPVQVQVNVANARIVSVTPLQVPNARSRSARISEIAIPMLTAEVLNVQSARIHGVSGATYTSVSYARSLQAALDIAHRG